MDDIRIHQPHETEVSVKGRILGLKNELRHEERKAAADPERKPRVDAVKAELKAAEDLLKKLPPTHAQRLSAKKKAGNAAE